MYSFVNKFHKCINKIVGGNIMSVLKSKRDKSRADFVSKANEIYTETLNFLSRLSARYSRILTADTAHLASKVLSNAVSAYSISPTDEVGYTERKVYLLRAAGALDSLDVHLSHVYEVLMMNPEGAFSTSNGKTVPGSRATEKLEFMAQSLGEKIDEEGKLIREARRMDKGIYYKIKKANMGASL